MRADAREGDGGIVKLLGDSRELGELDGALDRYPDILGF